MKDVRRLTTEIASGDAEAFARFYRSKFNHVYNVAKRATGFDEQGCLDVVQNTMLRVIRYMKPFDDEVRLRNWLVRVTRSAAFDHLRKERRRRCREQKAMEGRSQVEDEAPGELFERLDWLRHELRGLDRVSAEIIELRYRAGLTLEAIGRRLGMGTGAVHGRLTRTLAKLRKQSNVEMSDE